MKATVTDREHILIKATTPDDIAVLSAITRTRGPALLNYGSEHGPNGKTSESMLLGRGDFFSELRERGIRERGWQLKVKWFFAWYDLWIGAFYDRKAKALYICLLPCVVCKITREPKWR